MKKTFSLAVVCIAALLTVSFAPGALPRNRAAEYAVAYEWKYVPDYTIVSSRPIESGGDQSHSVFEIRFEKELLNRPDVKYPLQIELSCNGVIRRITLDSTMQTVIDVSPGTYTFMLAITNNFRFGEIVTQPISILPAHKTVIATNFRYTAPVSSDDKPQFVVFKPVIYTYADRDREVELTLHPKGAFTFTYPEHGSGWKGTAHPDGSMTIGGTTYPYLFWEAEQFSDQHLEDKSRGFVVERGNVTAFLEEKLTEMGLNTKEQTDFITFWGPRMTASEKGFARFLFNREYDAIGTLGIQPKPDNVFRVYLLWTPLPAHADYQPKPQKIPHVDRTGFYVIEWGGSELPYSTTLLSTQ